MSFNDFETSLASARPIRLYDFSCGALHWLYATADRDIEHRQNRYRACAISDDGIRQTGQASADMFHVSAPADIDVAQLYRQGRPSSKVSLTVRDLHHDDNESLVVWIGAVSDVKWPAQHNCVISCDPLGAKAKTGLHLCWQRTCPYTLYDQNCRVDPARHRETFRIAAMDGLVLQGTINRPDGWFAGGYVEWDRGSGVVEQRGIMRHVHNSLTLIGGTAGLSVAQTVSIYPGCDALIQTCQDKFNNSINCGAITNLPGKSPFDGDPIY